MEQERYPGERRGLRLFLEGLIGAVDQELGRDALLYHRIRIALSRGDLLSLRSARQMFNHQNAAMKRRLSLVREARRRSAGVPQRELRTDVESQVDGRRSDALSTGGVLVVLGRSGDGSD